MQKKQSNNGKEQEKNELINEFTNRFARLLLIQALIEREKKKGKPVDVQRIINDVLWM